jgi:hypothetical protein
MTHIFWLLISTIKVPWYFCQECIELLFGRYFSQTPLVTPIQMTGIKPWRPWRPMTHACLKRDVHSAHLSTRPCPLMKTWTKSHSNNWFSSSVSVAVINHRASGWLLFPTLSGYCETAELTFNEVIDWNRMSQMNVFQGLGHPYIPFNYIRILGRAAWWNNKMKWHASGDITWQNTTSTLHTGISHTLFIPYIWIGPIFNSF